MDAALDFDLTVPRGYHHRGVLCVPAATTTALDAFALMDAKEVSALGVCDGTHRVVANISVSDLRGIQPGTIDRLALPVTEFLRRQRADRRQRKVIAERGVGGCDDGEEKESVKGGATSTVASGGDDDVGVVTCGVECTVGDVVALMVHHRVHHVYACSTDGQPLAMITPHDVLRVLSDVLVEG